jgi:hypothetical protein
MPSRWKNEKSGNEPTYWKKWRFFCRFSFKIKWNDMVSCAIHRLISGHGYEYRPGMGSPLGFGSNNLPSCSLLAPLLAATRLAAPPRRCWDLAPLLAQVSPVHLIGEARPSPLAPHCGGPVRRRYGSNLAPLVSIADCARGVLGFRFWHRIHRCCYLIFDAYLYAYIAVLCDVYSDLAYLGSWRRLGNLKILLEISFLPDGMITCTFNLLHCCKRSRVSKIRVEYLI